MIASLHDKKGRITVKGMYDDVRPLSKAERAAFQKLPWSDKKYAKSLGLKQLFGERGFSTLERLWARPTLECNGIWGGYTGEGAKTVLPSKAFAKISMRIVPDQSSAKTAKLFERHLRSIAPKTVTVKVRRLHGGEPAITPVDSPGVQAAVAALEKGFGKKPLYQREGGSIPIVVELKKHLASIPCCWDSAFRMKTRTLRTNSSTSAISSAGSGRQRTITGELPHFWNSGKKK